MCECICDPVRHRSTYQLATSLYDLWHRSEESPEALLQYQACVAELHRRAQAVCFV